MDLTNKRIVVTGCTGQVGRPVAEAFAATNEVFGLARFADADAKAALEARGISCLPVDFVDPDLRDVPRDIDVVLHFAVTKSGNWQKDLAANAESAGHLMSHFRSADAFLACSTTAVYAPNGGQPMHESDGHGNHHEHVMPTYSISKIAAESVIRFAAVEFDLPTIIARLSVPYGDHTGWPIWQFMAIQAGQPVVVHSDGARYNPIHHDDIIAQIPALLDAAAVPATTVNWGGNDVVSIEEWSNYMAELIGAEASFESSDFTIPSAVCESTKQLELLGPCSIGWKDGFARLVANLNA